MEMLRSLKTNEEPILGKVYQGKRTDFDLVDGKRGNCTVTVNGEPLVNIDKLDWEWGFGRGKRISNLAESILTDYFGHSNYDYEVVQRFREKFIKLFPFDAWQVEEHIIDAFLDMIEQEWEKEKHA